MPGAGITWRGPSVGSFDVNGYAALYAVLINLAVTAVLSLVFNLVAATRGKDATAMSDYTEEASVPVAALAD